MTTLTGFAISDTLTNRGDYERELTNRPDYPRDNPDAATDYLWQHAPAVETKLIQFAQPMRIGTPMAKRQP